MTTQLTPAETVATVRALGDKFSWFHLRPCVCGAPVWQQPCPVCGHYPMSDGLRSCRRAVRNPSGTTVVRDMYVVPEDDRVTREEYDGIVAGAGGILEWYLKSFERCMDPQRHLLNQARESAKAQGLIFPTGAQLYDWAHGR